MNETVYSNPNEISFLETEKILRENAKYLILVRLNGGEPLLYSKFNELVDLLDELKIKFTILTNGYLLNSEKIKRILKNCIQISFSIDSSDAEIYNYMRGNDNFRIVNKNIEELNKIKKEEKVKTPILNFAAALFSFNISTLPNLIEYCAKNNISSISVAEGHDYETPLIRKDDLLMYYPELVSKWINIAKEKAKENRIILRLNSPILYFAKKTNQKVSQHDKITHCFNYYITAHINPDLDVSVCPLSYPISELKNKSLTNVWNEEYISGRKTLLNDKLPKQCRYCNDYNNKYLDQHKAYSYNTYSKINE